MTHGDDDIEPYRPSLRHPRQKTSLSPLDDGHPVDGIPSIAVGSGPYYTDLVSYLLVPSAVVALGTGVVAVLVSTY